MHFQLWIKSGFRYGLSYLVVSVSCAILIVIGNDLLIHSAHKGNLCDAILQINYKQWLPVCALSLAITFVLYLLFTRLLFRRLPLLVSALVCGLISVAIVLFSGISHASFHDYNWYELKNILTFFIAGFAFAIFAELLD